MTRVGPPGTYQEPTPAAVMCMSPTMQATPFSCNRCDFAIVEPQTFFPEIFASGQSVKILSRENFSPYGILYIRPSLFVCNEYFHV